MEGIPWFDTWIRDNLSTSDYWQGISYQGKENYQKIKVPSLAVTGWFDAVFPGTPMNYLGMKRYGGTPQARRPRIVIGPWPTPVGDASCIGSTMALRPPLIGTDTFVGGLTITSRASKTASSTTRPCICS